MCTERIMASDAETMDCALSDSLSVKECADAATSVARRAARSEEYRTHPIPEELLAELPVSWEGGVRLLAQTRDVLLRNYPNLEDVDAVLRHAWAAAYQADAFRAGDHDSILLPLPLPRRDDPLAPVELAVKVARNQGEGGSEGALSLYAPFVRYRGERPASRSSAGAPGEPDGAGSSGEGTGVGEKGDVALPVRAPLETCPSHRALLTYAYVPSMELMTQECADMASAEDWGAGLAPWSRSAMESYICVTFARAQEQGRVVVSESGSFSALNTGLKTPFGTDLFLCFEAQSSAYRRHWRLLGPAEAGSGHLGKELVHHFGANFPQPPTYGDGGAISWKIPVFVDYRHIIMKRLSRLPLAFLYRALSSDAVAFRMVCEAADASSRDERDRRFERLQGHVASTPSLVTSIRRKLDEAVEVSLGRVRDDDGLVAGAYNPAKGECFLLPAWLAGAEHPDVAMVASLDKGAAQVHTVIGLDAARASARVVMKTLPWWLRVNPMTRAAHLRNAA